MIAFTRTSYSSFMLGILFAANLSVAKAQKSSRTDSLLKEYNTNSNPISQQKALFEVSNLFDVQNNEEALSKLEQELKKTYKKINNPEALAYAYHTLCTYRQHYQDYDSAFYWLDKSYATALTTTNDELKFLAQKRFARINYVNGNLTAAIEANKKAVVWAKNIHNMDAYAFCYENMAQCYTNLMSYDKAMENYLICKSILDTCKSISPKKLIVRKAFLNQYLGDHFSLQKKNALARKYYKESFKNFSSAKDTSNLARSLAAMAYTYDVVKDRDSALACLDNVVKNYPDYIQSHDFDDRLNVAVLYSDYANIYHSNKEYDKAIAYWKKAKKEFEALKMQYNLSIVEYDMGMMHLDVLKDYTKALVYCQHAYDIANEIDYVDNKRDACDCLSRAYKAKGDYVKALKYAQEYILLNDSVINDEKKQKTIELQSKFEFTVREDSINAANTLLQQQQEAEIKNRSLIGIALGIGLISLCIILYLINKRAKLLQETQIQTQKNLEEKEVLLREIHHRVKNNLAVISGLLYLQKNRVSDETIKGVLLEGQNRIDSMVLVHEMLYQSNNIAAIDLKSYLSKLISQIANGFESKVFNFTIAGTATLEPKQAVPLGLILTELITNIYKYAYPDTQTGTFGLSITNMDGNQLLIVLKDNGKGLPNDFDINNSKTLGIKLVKMLCQQMKAVLNFSTNQGTEVSMLFNINKGLE